MRRAAKPDANHAAIRDALRRLAIVIDVHDYPAIGCDLVVMTQGRIWFVEVKDGAKPPSARTLTDNEARMQRLCKASGNRYAVVTTVDEALDLVRNPSPLRPQ